MNRPSISCCLSLCLSVLATATFAQTTGVPSGAQRVAPPAAQQPISRQQMAQQPGAANGETQVRVPLLTSQQAVQEGLAQVPQQPFPPLQPEEQNFLDQVLDVWEKRTAQVTKYECDFTRWQYDPTMYPESFSSRAMGKIKYMDPDKGLFCVDKLEVIAEKQPQPVYKVNPRQPHGEYWVCDGRWVYIRDRNEKKETQIELPPQMRGQAIYQSPLPFLFGVNASEIKQRYWIRPIQGPAGDDSVWLEAWPKRADDAGNYSRVQVVLDRKDILPRALVVFLPNWRPGHEHKEIYEFSNRNTPGNSLWDAVKEKVFRQEFIPTMPPADWQVIQEPYIPPEQQPPVAGQDRLAVPPAAGQPIR